MRTVTALALHLALGSASVDSHTTLAEEPAATSGGVSGCSGGISGCSGPSVSSSVNWPIRGG